MLYEVITHEAIVLFVDHDHIAGGKLACQDFLRQGIFQRMLDGTFQRPRAVHLV